MNCCIFRQNCMLYAIKYNHINCLNDLYYLLKPLHYNDSSYLCNLAVEHESIESLEFLLFKGFTWDIYTFLTASDDCLEILEKYPDNYHDSLSNLCRLNDN